MAWAMYDWANSAFLLIIITAIFPIYFANVAAEGLAPGVATFRYSLATTAGLLIIAILAPFLGAVADFAGIKKRMLGTFLALGVVATGLMFFIERGDWILAALLFIAANIGANGSYVFYDALLPHITRDSREMDRVSTAGYAMGYLGSALLMVLVIAWILKPAWFGLPADPSATLPTRLAFVAVALWWLGFSIPLFRQVPEPPARREPDEPRTGSFLRAAVMRLRETLGELRGFRNAFLMLLAFLIYNDGIGTIIRMAAIYGAEIGIGPGALIGSILLVQIIGVPFAFLFGALAGRIGPRHAIFLGLATYVGISIFGYLMTTATHFLILAVLVGMVQGGTQALSRSLFASMIPRHKSGEFFGFFAVVEKFAGIFGPALFAIAIVMTGSSRAAILSVIVFFVVGGLLLLR
ncbi:MAG: MFS transporter, partial [Gemmatimonadales bacterium]